MGGAKDSILPKTERVILEVANFEATGIRRTEEFVKVIEEFLKME